MFCLFEISSYTTAPSSGGKKARDTTEIRFGKQNLAKQFENRKVALEIT